MCLQTGHLCCRIRCATTVSLVRCFPPQRLPTAHLSLLRLVTLSVAGSEVKDSDAQQNHTGPHLELTVFISKNKCLKPKSFASPPYFTDRSIRVHLHNAAEVTAPGPLCFDQVEANHWSVKKEVISMAWYGTRWQAARLRADLQPWQNCSFLEKKRKNKANWMTLSSE